MDLGERFGKRLRQLRRERRWTQGGLGRRAGLTAKYVGQLERGEACPSLRTLEQLAKAFGVSVGELLGEGGGAAGEHGLRLWLTSDERQHLKRVVETLRRLLGRPQVSLWGT